jgi:hypothetical protein
MDRWPAKRKRKEAQSMDSIPREIINSIGFRAMIKSAKCPLREEAKKKAKAKNFFPLSGAWDLFGRNPLDHSLCTSRNGLINCFAFSFTARSPFTKINQSSDVDIIGSIIQQTLSRAHVTVSPRRQRKVQQS